MQFCKGYLSEREQYSAMKKSILIVDDDRNTCISIGKALSKNYITHTASNGQEALDILYKNRDIQIILTDIIMPEMNGLELLEKIHFLNNKKIVIMITGYTELESAMEAKHLGVYDYISKPVDLDRLEASLKNAFEKIEFN